MVSYILWDIDSDLFSIGPFTLRWNALLLLASYVFSQRILVAIYKNELKATKEAAFLTTCVVVSALAGARLGYVIFFEPELFWSNPIKIFLPFEIYPQFHFTGMEGFSVHGATIGILFGTWIFSVRKKNSYHYFQLLDRLSIIAAITGFFIFMGSFLNSDISGKPTNFSAGTVFIEPVNKGLLKIPCCIMRNPNGENPLSQVISKKNKVNFESGGPNQSIILYLFFKHGVSEQLVKEFLIGDVKTFLYDMPKIVFEPGTEPLHYTIIVQKDGQFIGRIITKGISRYPIQIIEAISCLMLFIFMFVFWVRHKVNVAPARLFGYFMMLFWSLHLVYSNLKEMHGDFEVAVDIAFALVGLVAVIFSYQTVKVKQLAKE